ncbi:MAG TPA: pyrroline-5-carboxylate reductase [Steroidobacteraceae bacterium]|nr:pyrroline-5-carboxylate reductase [Steroidobacteraceae bacterium]
MNQRIAIIGGGNMARSLVGGLTARGFEPGLITVAEPVEAQRRQLEESWRVRTSADNVSAVRGAGAVVFAVKPQNMRAVATQVAEAIKATGAVVLSIAAGIRVRDLERWLGSSTAIVRSMPNRPALIGRGVSALFAEPSVGPAARQAAEGILSAVGATLWVEKESLIDAVTAVSGSGPAYFFLLMELLEAAARDLGLPPETARQLSVETAYGAACMAHARVDDPATLREQVTSRGGTTAAALAVFEHSDLAGIVRRAVAAAAHRSAELAAEFGGGDSR